MPSKMLIDATHAEETRVVVVDGNKVEEFDFETINKRQLAGNIYLAKVTRVEPSLQAAFVDYGGNRHGFLAFAEIHPDYYQIPVADRQALIEEERAMQREAADEENNGRSTRRQSPRRDAPRAEAAGGRDPVAKAEINGMDVVDLDDDAEGAADAGTPVSDAPAADHDHADDDHSHASDEAETPYRAMDHASETDDEIESIADEDVAEEIRAPRKPRARRYKIQEVVKVRQIMLIQVVKEERGNKGAALTTYLSLAGRYCVLMPNTARGGGISRKITQAVDRKKLKEIAQEIEVPEGAGLIIRTAGAKRTKPEIRRDYEYLMRLWEQVRELTLKSIAPAPIYEEGDLIKRSIRDLYSKEIDEVLVEGEAGYRTAKDFMRMIMPSHAKAVKRYNEPMPLFARHQVESYLAGMFNPTVQLKSGGYIVIGVTEALVAIDVNSGRATKEGSIEETALKTNLEAAEEVARQLRLRDLAGLIVIDFIDMEERRNNASVEKRLKDKLKTDRARIQVGRISGFGLMEMSRQRLRPGMLESTTQPCAHCHGTGLIRSDESLALTILRALEEEGTRKRSKEVLLRGPVAVLNFLMNNKREHIALIEARYGMAVRLEADPSMISPDYVIDKFKTATRVVPEPSAVISGNAGLMGAAVDEDEDDDIVDEVDEDEAEAEADAPRAQAEGATANGDGEGGKKKRRRRRRRRGGSGANGANGASDAGEDGSDEDDAAGPEAEPASEDAADDSAAQPAKKPSRSRSRSRSSSRSTGAAVVSEDVAEVAPVTVAADEPAGDAPAKPKTTRTRTRKPKADETVSDVAPVVTPEPAAAAPVVAESAPAPVVSKPAPAAKPTRSRTPKAAAAADVAPVAPVAAEPAPTDAAPVPADPAASADPADDAEAKPKRKGWWSLGR